MLIDVLNFDINRCPNRICIVQLAFYQIFTRMWTFLWLIHSPSYGTAMFPYNSRVFSSPCRRDQLTERWCALVKSVDAATTLNASQYQNTRKFSWVKMWGGLYCSYPPYYSVLPTYFFCGKLKLALLLHFLLFSAVVTMDGVLMKVIGMVF